MLSTQISRASAAVLALFGLGLLFVPDLLLPRLIPGFPPEGAWLGQLLSAAWLGLAALNWLNQRAMLGGIYARPVVMANVGHYFIGAMVLGKVVARPDAPRALWLLFAPIASFAAVYAWLLLRGPFEGDLVRQRQEGSGG